MIFKKDARLRRSQTAATSSIAGFDFVPRRYSGHAPVQYWHFEVASTEYEVLDQNDVVRDGPCGGRVMCYVQILAAVVY